METNSRSRGRRRGEAYGVGSNSSDGVLTPVEYQVTSVYRLVRLDESATVPVSA
jgi:hypothetical protein